MYVSKKNKKHKSIKQRGFVLILSLLMASLLASLGLAMYSIASKELALTSVGKNSQYAFYAADSGIECALYWAYKKDAFSTTVVYQGPPAPECGGQPLRDFPSSGGEGVFDGIVGLGDSSPTTFWFEPNGYCTYITITKSATIPYTKIVALGYNTACNDPNNPKRLEQAVQSSF